MKKISVNLDDMGEQHLAEIMNINDCTVTDAIHMALLVFAKENTERVTIPVEDSPIEKISKIIREKMGMSFPEYCDLRHLDKDRFRYLVNRCEAGSTVWGFGNADKSNKWRDKDRGVRCKTHTAWIATCLIDDLGIDIT